MAVDQATGTETMPHPRGLRILLGAAAISVTGDGVLVTAAPLMAAALTRDPFQVGLVAAAGYAAWIIFGLPAGALVDRWDRRRVMYTADLLRALILAGFAALAFANMASIATLVIAVFLVGVGSCFFDPASQSLMPDLAGRDRDNLTRANGALWGIDVFGKSLAGPPLGAVTFAAGRALPFAADALSFVVSALLVRTLPAVPREPWEHPPVRDAVVSGLRFVASHSDLRRLALGMGAYNFAWNLGFATLVLFAQDVLSLGAAGYGALMASGAVGGILAGWLVPKLASGAAAPVAYAVALTGQALVWSAIAFGHTQWVAFAAIAVLGAASTAVSVIGGTARQLLTPPAMLGRMISATRLVGIGSAASGAFVGGLLSNLYGLTAPMIAAVGLAALAACYFALIARR
ncbi:MFS transporter [Hamadaea sp. NPDC051192]|uniref:MFS transporter n=1 Tax=Hamadaea sp. NPDC051192 TaxID=3154940 RepID=UPI0034421EAB